MTSLTAIFGSSEEKSEEDSEKLLQLYWNRAELKKEFAELRAEKYRLQDRVKEEQGATARVEQKLSHLEKLLLDPEWVYNVVVYYRLKHLNLLCQNKLEKFAEQLKQQREERQHSELLEEWNQARAEEAQRLEQQIGEHRIQVQMLEDRLMTQRQRLVSMNGLERFFKKRSATAELDELAAAIDAAQLEEQALLNKYDEIENREPPDTQGLDIHTKRIINFSILAFAQAMYLHFRDDGLAELAKVADDRSVGAVNYGGKAECDRILEQVQDRLEALERSTNYADVLRQRAQLIAEKAKFGSDSDAVPTAASVSTVYDIGERGRIKELEVNLLGQDYWNLAGAVSR